MIKEINDPMMMFSMKLMAYKILRKCRKEEALVGVMAVISQCAKGIVFNWVPYLLNQFLIDYRDAQDNDIELHYSWILILIASAGWKELKFTSFLDRKGNSMQHDM